MWRYKLLKVGKLQKTKGPTKDVTYSVFEREIDIASYIKKKIILLLIIKWKCHTQVGT